MLTFSPRGAKLLEAEVLPKLVSSVSAACKREPQMDPCKDGPAPP